MARAVEGAAVIWQSNLIISTIVSVADGRPLLRRPVYGEVDIGGEARVGGGQFFAVYAIAEFAEVRRGGDEVNAVNVLRQRVGPDGRGEGGEGQEREQEKYRQDAALLN